MSLEGAREKDQADFGVMYGSMHVGRMIDQLSFPRFRQTILSLREFLLFLGARREKSRIPLSERDSARALNAKFLTRDFLLHGDPYIATDHNQRRFPSPVIDRHLLML